MRPDPPPGRHVLHDHAHRLGCEAVPGEQRVERRCPRPSRPRAATPRTRARARRGRVRPGGLRSPPPNEAPAARTASAWRSPPPRPGPSRERSSSGPRPGDSRACARSRRAAGSPVAGADGRPAAPRHKTRPPEAQPPPGGLARVEKGMPDPLAAPGRQQHRFGEIEDTGGSIPCALERRLEIAVLVDQRQGGRGPDQPLIGEGRHDQASGAAAKRPRYQAS
jgi:hypothetical protein